jgi:aminobenzoyl-glutamate utilization protein B
MARAGLFDDCDAVLHWHPAARNTAGDQTALARLAVKFRFHGTSAHAAAAPEQGRSALEAVDLTNHAVALLREHTPDGTRLHHVITDGGGAPNVVPDFAEVYYYIRHPQADVVRALYPRVLKCAQAGALATETRLEVVPEGGTVELVTNAALAAVVKANLARLNDLAYGPEEEKFAARIQSTLAAPKPLDSIHRVDEAGGTSGRGSTDVGDVSWVVPTAGFTAVCWVPGTPGHSWQAVAAGNTTIGRQGMMLAARTLAASAWDLFEDPRLLAAARAEHRSRLAGRKYRPLLEPDQKPPLNYRNPPRALGEKAEGRRQ